MDELGDNLREIRTEIDSQVQGDSVKAASAISYRNLILGIFIPLFTFITFISLLGWGCATADYISEKLDYLNLMTGHLFDNEIFGLSLGIIFAAVFILFLRKNKQEMADDIISHEKYPGQIYSTCPACNVPFAPGNSFCTNCGQKL